MLSKVEGFEVEVAVQDGTPHVSVRFRDGKPLFETAALSVTGLERMAAVFASAARMAQDELEIYWQLQREAAANRE